MRAGYSPSQGFGALAGSQRFSPPVFWPYGIPLNVSTPPSTNPRTFPYWVFATAERGVEHPSGAECAAVFVLSEAVAWPASADAMPAVAGRISAWRRFRVVCLSGFDLDIPSPSGEVPISGPDGRHHGVEAATGKR